MTSNQLNDSPSRGGLVAAAATSMLAVSRYNSYGLSRYLTHALTHHLIEHLIFIFILELILILELTQVLNHIYIITINIVIAVI